MPITSSVRYNELSVGEPAPWFVQRSSTNPRHAFDTAAGRYIVLCFVITGHDARGRAAVELMQERHQYFDGKRVSAFVITMDPADERDLTINDGGPGLRYFWDFDGKVSSLYGAVPLNSSPASGATQARRLWMILDPTLRIKRIFPFLADSSEDKGVFDYLDHLPPPELFAGFDIPPPVLILPDAFEPGFCHRLLDLYEADGGTESGVLRQVGDRTEIAFDPAHKKRKDYLITDPGILREVQRRIARRIVPDILKAFQFKATRIERYLVSCYSSREGGHFRAHRDNTTKGGEHRRFAVSINLNEDFAGGELSFPEYGRRSFKAPRGCAVVFSCSLLHAVSEVTEGHRYAFLPFLFDEEAVKRHGQTIQENA
jgi:peroxiredoxin